MITSRWRSGSGEPPYFPFSPRQTVMKPLGFSAVGLHFRGGREIFCVLIGSGKPLCALLKETRSSSLERGGGRGQGSVRAPLPPQSRMLSSDGRVAAQKAPTTVRSVTYVRQSRKHERSQGGVDSRTPPAELSSTGTTTRCIAERGGGEKKQNTNMLPFLSRPRHYRHHRPLCPNNYQIWWASTSCPASTPPPRPPVCPPRPRHTSAPWTRH